MGERAEEGYPPWTALFEGRESPPVVDESWVANRKRLPRSSELRLNEPDQVWLQPVPNVGSLTFARCKECQNGAVFLAAGYASHCAEHHSLVEVIEEVLESGTAGSIDSQADQVAVSTQFLSTRAGSSAEQNVVSTSDVSEAYGQAKKPCISPPAQTDEVDSQLSVPPASVGTSPRSTKSSSGKASSRRNRGVSGQGTATSRGSPGRENVYNANIHCGVWVPHLNKNCTRSLACKTHSLNQRRSVPGRTGQFDEMLAEHKKARLALKQRDETQAAGLGLKPLTNVKAPSPTVSQSQTTTLSTSAPTKEEEASHGSNLVPDDLTTDVIEWLEKNPEQLCWSTRHPQPAVAPFASFYNACTTRNRHRRELQDALQSLVLPRKTKTAPDNSSSSKAAAVLKNRSFHHPVEDFFRPVDSKQPLASFTLAKLEAMSAAVKDLRSEHKKGLVWNHQSTLVTPSSEKQVEDEQVHVDTKPVLTALPGSASVLVGNSSDSDASASSVVAAVSSGVCTDRKPSFALCKIADLKALLKSKTQLDWCQHDDNAVFLDDVLAPNSVTQIGRSVRPSPNLEKMRVSLPQSAYTAALGNGSLSLASSLPVRSVHSSSTRPVGTPLYAAANVLTSQPGSEAAWSTSNTQHLRTVPHTAMVGLGDGPTSVVGVTSQSLLPGAAGTATQVCLPPGKQGANGRQAQVSLPSSKDHVQTAWKALQSSGGQPLTDQHRQLILSNGVLAGSATERSSAKTTVASTSSDVIRRVLVTHSSAGDSCLTATPTLVGNACTPVHSYHSQGVSSRNGVPPQTVLMSPAPRDRPV